MSVRQLLGRATPARSFKANGIRLPVAGALGVVISQEAFVALLPDRLDRRNEAYLENGEDGPLAPTSRSLQDPTSGFDGPWKIEVCGIVRDSCP